MKAKMVQSSTLWVAIDPDMNVTFSSANVPHIQWNHVDGPLLTCRTGALHWLTLWERIKMKYGWTTIEELDAKYIDGLGRF